MAQVDELEGALAEAEETIDSLEESLAQQRAKWEDRGDDEKAQAQARRVESLERALQASVEHNAEQEEALLRWQELAQATQEQVRCLEDRLEQVREQLVAEEEAAQDRDDQILWYRVSLSVTQERLRASRAALQQKEKRLQTVRRDLARQRTLANTWKARVGRLSELLYESIQRVKENEARLNVLATKLDEEPAQVASTEDEVEVT